jgi:hypothetical protein
MKNLRTLRHVLRATTRATAAFLLLSTMHGCGTKPSFADNFSEVARVDYDDATMKQRTITDGNLSVVIERLHRPMVGEYPDDSLPSFRATVYQAGRRVGEFKNMSDKSLFQIAEMDTSNPFREVIAASFSGGATGCCNDVQVLTSDPDGKNWSTVRTELFWGPTGAEKLLPNRPFALFNNDANWIYDHNISECANLKSSLRILELHGLTFINTVRQPEYKPIIFKRTGCQPK